MKTQTKRGFIFDLVSACALVLIVLTSTLSTTLRLITQQDRPVWAVGVDWLCLILTAVLITLTACAIRRILAAVDREEAERVERKAQLHATIGASHAEPAELRQAVKSVFEQSARRAGQL